MVFRASAVSAVVLMVAFLILAGGVTRANAEFHTLEELAKQCDPKTGGRDGVALCYGYIAGVVDAMDAQRVPNGAQQCLPPNVRLKQVVENLFRFVVNNEDRAMREGWATESASTVVIIATGNTWCPMDSEYSKGLR
jgi:Rap1a immunity proteins